MQIITGFHAIEELLRSVEAQLEKKHSEVTGAAIKHSETGVKSAGGKAGVNAGKAASDGKADVSAGKVASGGRACGLRLTIFYAKHGPRV